MTEFFHILSFWCLQSFFRCALIIIEASWGNFAGFFVLCMCVDERFFSQMEEMSHTKR